MGEALSLKKVQLAVVAAIAALALGFTMFGAQAAYADEGQYQAGTLAVQSADPGTSSDQGSGATKATYKTAANGAAAVSYTKCQFTGKTATIPATIKIAGKSFKVTTVSANAFKGTKVTAVTVGKNVTKLAKNAFKGATKLKTVTIKTTKLTKAGVKGAFKGSKVTKVKVPKAKYKAYKKIFTNANCGKKVKVVK